MKEDIIKCEKRLEDEGELKVWKFEMESKDGLILKLKIYKRENTKHASIFLDIMDIGENTNNLHIYHDNTVITDIANFERINEE